MQLETDEGKKGEEAQHSIARLCEKRGEGAWLVRWFYRPDDVAQHAFDRCASARSLSLSLAPSAELALL